MARGDGIDRTSARNAKMTAAKVGNAQAHNERQKESYVRKILISGINSGSMISSLTAMIWGGFSERTGALKSSEAKQGTKDDGVNAKKICEAILIGRLQS